MEWFASSIGAVFAGYEVVLVTELATNVFIITRGLSAGVCTTNNEETYQLILKDCRANIVVVENAKLLNAVIKVHSLHICTYVCL